MPQLLDDATQEEEAADLVTNALGVCPLRIVPQPLGSSGKSVFRVYLPEKRSVVLRTSVRPKTFGFTRRNLDVLRALELPVQSVLAAGPTASGGSYMILNWIPGRDLVHELAGMSRGQMSRLAEQVVDAQRRLGSLPASNGFGWAPIGQNAPLENWSSAFGQAAPASMVDDGTLLGGLRARLCLLRSRVEPYFSTVPARAFLDDLTTKNVLVENGVLSGIIDVDFVCYGDPLLAVGATMASLAADLPEAAAFYGAELVRCSSPTAQERLAVWFYAALWGIGTLSLTDAAVHPTRAGALVQAAQSWLRLAEGL